jgi:hypothetical protein
MFNNLTCLIEVQLPKWQLFQIVETVSKVAKLISSLLYFIDNIQPRKYFENSFAKYP